MSFYEILLGTFVINFLIAHIQINLYGKVKEESDSDETENEDEWTITLSDNLKKPCLV